MSIHNDDILQLDLYEIIGATIESHEAEIRSAYRKKALTCHPDKKPGDLEAAKLFLQLSKALEVLTDVKAKAAYDKVIKDRLESKKRRDNFNAKKRKYKEDLIRNEQISKKNNEKQFREEWDRLTREGSKTLTEEQKHLRELMLEHFQDKETGHNRVKLRWKLSLNDTTNGGYSYENLNQMLSQYGEISTLVISKTSKGKAFVEYKDIADAEAAVKNEMGLLKNPLKLEGLWRDQIIFRKQPAEVKPNFNKVIEDNLKDQKRAEERKQLIEQMMKEDLDE